MKDLKSLLFKDENSNNAIAFVQSLEQLIQNGNDITKEQFEKILNSLPRDLLNENIDINQAYSQFITEFARKDKSQKDDQNNSNNNDNSNSNNNDNNNNNNSENENVIISKVFYARIKETCLNPNLTFTQAIEKIKEIEKDYYDRFHEKFPFVENQTKSVDQFIEKIQNVIDSNQQKVKTTINKDTNIQSLSTSELEQKIADEVTKSLNISTNDKAEKALFEKGKAQIIDTIIREISPVERVKRTIQDVKMDSTLREIEKIDKILQMMKASKKAIPEFEEEIKKLEKIKETYFQRKIDFSNHIFMEKAKGSANQDRKKVIEKFDKGYLKILDKKFNEDKLKTDKYKDLLTWDNSSKLVKELKEDIIKNSNLEGYSEIKKIETYIHFYENELRKKESTTAEAKNMKDELDKLVALYQCYESVKKHILQSIHKAINKDETFENLNARGKKRKINQLIDENLKLFDMVKNFDAWDDPKKLKEELKNDIQKEILNPKKAVVENKGKDISKWKKALVGGLGFVAGIGLEIVLKTHPVLGTVATAYTLARTVYNASKLTCAISTKINHGNEPKIITGIKNIVPNKVKELAKLVLEKPSNPYVRSFVNGASLGYTTANIYQRFIAPQPDTTVTVIDDNKLTTPAPTEAPTPTPNASVTPTVTTTPTATVTTTPKVTTTPTATVTTTPTTPSISDASNISNVDIPTFKTGNVMDISNLEYGYTGPGQHAVHLLNNRGVNAVFDKTNVINGQTWVHFKQANGAGYAWFPKEEVEEMLTSVSSGRTR